MSANRRHITYTKKRPTAECPLTNDISLTQKKRPTADTNCKRLTTTADVAAAATGIWCYQHLLLLTTVAVAAATTGT